MAFFHSPMDEYTMVAVTTMTSSTWQAVGFEQGTPRYSHGQQVFREARRRGDEGGAL